MTNDIRIVIIGGSAGSYSTVKKILSSISEDFPLPVVLCLHRLKDVRNGFVESLNIDTKLKVIEPNDKDPIKPCFAYLSPSNYHLMIEPGHSFALSTDPDLNYSRPSIDIIFETAGYSFREKMAGIILSGANTDGAKGLHSAFKNGAYTIIQNPENARFNTMPKEVLKYFAPHKTLTDEEIVVFINSLKGNKYV
jgi:two-component system, chemotaxis family, protein-glutamate methylesterase/glutaminase